MVRWVFRPYTQIRRAICTLASRRTSTRVSPGFILPKYSSPSFGSSSIYSNFRSHDSNEEQALHPISIRTQVNNALNISPFNSYSVFSLSFRIRAFIHTLILAYKWDSLVRVSRRVNLIYSYWEYSLFSNIKCLTTNSAVSRSTEATGVNLKSALEDPNTRLRT